MKLSTKALLTSLVAATINAAPSAYRQASQRSQQRYEQILRKHDRKGELRAAVLGVSPQDFRHQERHRSLISMVRLHGFANERVFYQAVMGKIREELHSRGWTPRRIERFEMAQLLRLA